MTTRRDLEPARLAPPGPTPWPAYTCPSCEGPRPKDWGLCDSCLDDARNLTRQARP